jgi:3',5'-nucleoside bisphosphate phosphatase
VTPRFDLQSHSIYSDGALPPADVVRAAAAAGIELLALTDHDSVDGIDEALAAAAAAGIGLVPAVELSAVHEGYEDLHVLGYGIDHHDAEFVARTEDARADRVVRAERMAEKLRELGYEVDESVLERRRASGRSIGRPHLSQAVVDHPANRERLAREGLEIVERFLPAYLIPGTPAYLPRTRPTVPEAISWIHDAGGVAIWAHPFWDMDADQHVLNTIDRFREAGLDGVECFYGTFTRAQTELLVAHCSEAGLLRTGSSDFHGPEHKLFSRFGAFELYGLEPDLGPLI